MNLQITSIAPNDPRFLGPLSTVDDIIDFLHEQITSASVAEAALCDALSTAYTNFAFNSQSNGIKSLVMFIDGR